MAYGDLPRRTASEKVLYDKAFNIAKNPKFDGYQRGHKCFDNKSAGGSIKNMLNEELAEELHKPIIRKFKKRKVNSPF